MESPVRTLGRGRAPARLIATAIAVALIAALTALEAPGAAALELGTARRGQSYYESVMLQADRLVRRLDNVHDALRRDVRRADRKLDRARAHREWARRIAHAREDRYRGLQQQAPEEGEYVPKGYESRLRRAENEFRRAQANERRLDRKTIRASRVKAAKQHRLAVIRRSLRGAIARREGAEGALGGLIVTATRLAQQRAELKTYVKLGTEGSFVWPSMGSITQGFGCTGFFANPRRGSCSHFHDGLDISPSAGTRIGAVATGVVAYVGWNPWDREGRAFIVVVGHADGYVSRYGHLIPNRRVAHAGQVLYRGQTLGYMGSTGFSTGVHLHVEILRHGSPVDPRSLFPQRDDPGGAKKADKKKSDKGKKADKKKADKKADKQAKRGGQDADRGSKRNDGGKRTRGNAAADKKSESRAEDAKVEEVPDVLASAGGPAQQSSLTLDACEPTLEVPGAEEREAEHEATLSDLADQLKDAVAGCEAPDAMASEDESWSGESSPWDLTALEDPEEPIAA